MLARVLAFFAKPRETPLADNLVLTASAKPDPAAFTLLSRMQDKHHAMEHLDMAAECLDHMAAGIDTTGGASPPFPPFPFPPSFLMERTD